MLQMIFEWISSDRLPAGGYAAPKTPRGSDGKPRTIDGVKYLSVEQAAEKTGQPVEALSRDWLDTFAGMLGDDQKFFTTPEEMAGVHQPAGAGGVAGGEPVIELDPKSAEGIRAKVAAAYDPHFDLLRAWKYSYMDDDNWLLWLELCRLNGINPWSGWAWPDFVWDEKTKQNRLVLAVTDQGLCAKASATGEWVGTSEPKFDYSETGELLKATLTVYRHMFGQARPFVGVAKVSEYRHIGLQQYADDMPEHRLRKCAKAVAIRDAFAAEVGKLYTDDELGPRRLPSSPPPAPAQSRPAQSAGRDGVDEPWQDYEPEFQVNDDRRQPVGAGRRA